MNSDDPREGNSPDSLIYCTKSVKPQTGSCLLVGTSAQTCGLGDLRRRVAMNQQNEKSLARESTIIKEKHTN